MLKVGLCLSGRGVLDGAEIHESVLTQPIAGICIAPAMLAAS